MANFFDRVFKSDKTMKVTLPIMLACWIYTIVRNMIVAKLVDSLLLSLLVVTSVYGIIVVWTYKTHDKNIMKPALGMLMGAVVVFFSVSLFGNIFTEANRDVYFDNGTIGYLTMIVDILKLAVFLVFSLMHLAMNKTHESSPKLVQYNKLQVVILLILYIIEIVISFPTLNAGEIINKIVFYLGMTNLTILICNIETKIDYFRAVRQAKKQQEQ